jgi:hypothetical protein
MVKLSKFTRIKNCKKIINIPPVMPANPAYLQHPPRLFICAFYAISGKDEKRPGIVYNNERGGTAKRVSSVPRNTPFSAAALRGMICGQHLPLRGISLYSFCTQAVGGQYGALCPDCFLFCVTSRLSLNCGKNEAFFRALLYIRRENPCPAF